MGAYPLQKARADDIPWIGSGRNYQKEDGKEGDANGKVGDKVLWAGRWVAWRRAKMHLTVMPGSAVVANS